MTHKHFASAGLGVVLVASLLGTSVPAGAADQTTATTSAVPAVPRADGGVPTTLTFHGGRDHQELGRRLNQQPCDLDGDGLGDITAGSGVMYGSKAHADMPAYRRAVAGRADSYTDLPQWWSWTTSAATPGWSCAGDTNGDGFDDIVQLPSASSRVVSLNLYTDVRTSAGRLQENRAANYQFPAGATALAQTAAGPAGDLDGDGLGDVVVSRHTASSHGRTGNGELWVLAGQSSPTVPTSVATVAVSESADAAQVPMVVVGAADGDGLAVAHPMGDLNGDGLDDLAVAAPGSGRVWLVHGRAGGAEVRVVDLADLDPADGRLWVRAASGTGLGASLTVLDDIDGDGVRDLAVGAAAGPDDDGGVAVVRSGDAGTVVVDPAAGTVTGDRGAQGYWIRGERAGDGFGYALAGIGDVDGDGRGDLLVGAPGHDPVDASGTLTDAGAAYVLHGRAGDTAQSVAGLATADGHRIDGSRGAAQATGRASRFGAQVAAVGDVDGNGTSDFAISAPGRSDHATYRQGGVFVALRGEVATALGLATSRRVGDGGVQVLDGGTVPAGARLDLRASLRLATLQGVAGVVGFEVDGREVTGCEAVAAEVAAPHRSFALCETGLSLGSFGEHVLAASYDGVAGRLSGAQSPATTVYATDTATTTLRATGTADDPTLRAEVRATTSGVVSGGEVRFETVEDSGVASAIVGCEAVPVVEGRAACEPAAGLGEQRVQASHSGITVDNAVRPGERVEVLAPSTSGAQGHDDLFARSVGLTLSRGTVRHGGQVLAIAEVTPAMAAEVDFRVDGRSVGTATAADGTARLQLPRALTVGTHRVVAALPADETYAAATSAAVALRVRKAVVGTVEVTAPRFVRGTRPRLTVTVGPLSNGAQPVGTVRVTAAGRTTTAALTAARRGRVTVTLPRRHRAALAVRVAFVPRDTTTVATPRTVTTRLRPRG